MTNPYIVDRALDYRSKLRFYFPYEDKKFFKVTIPFFENPSIKERKKARYKKHSLISRSSNLYTYHGADSREFDLSFNFTIPHILEEYGELNSDDYMSVSTDTENAAYQQARFKKEEFGLADVNNPLQLSNEYRNIASVKASAQKNLKSFGFDPLQGLGSGEFANAIDKFDPGVLISEQNLFPNGNSSLTKSKYNTLNIIMYWIDIVRTSVTNNAQNPLYGPPIIRMIHGTLYQDIPCICTDYNIEYVEAAGYDVQSLMPRQIKIRMKLEEFRSGNFGKFNGDSYNPTTRDNLAGWEAVLEGKTHSTDPGAKGPKRTALYSYAYYGVNGPPPISPL